MDATDDSDYILGDALLDVDGDEDDLLIQSDFNGKRNDLSFAMDDIENSMETDGILNEGPVGDSEESALDRPIKIEADNRLPVEFTDNGNDAISYAKHFLSPNESSKQLPVAATVAETAEELVVNPEVATALPECAAIADLPDITVIPAIDLSLLPRDEGGHQFIEHMDIRAPVSVIRIKLQKKLGVDLSNFEFWLQDAQKLEPEKNLVDQCIQGEGLVQINVELLKNKINIVDVLKPTEEYLEKQRAKSMKKPAAPPPPPSPTPPTPPAAAAAAASAEPQWMVDHTFMDILTRLKIPKDPRKWDKNQVKMWLQWASQQFRLEGIKASDWSITGQQLVNMTQEEFQQRYANDKDGVLWTHLELLRRCDVFAILVNDESGDEEGGGAGGAGMVNDIVLPESPPPRKKTTATKASPVNKYKEFPKKSRILGSNQAVCERRSGVNTMTGTGTSPIQLWQFLLELLTDKNHLAVIHWETCEGEFKLEQPERVAELWGRRKNKPNMTYEKLSRALRYYYDGDMIAKVPGKRFVYKFVCDVEELIGYSPARLNNLVIECAQKNNLIKKVS